MLEAALFAGLRLFVASPHLARLGASLLNPAPIPELKALHRRSADQAHAGLRALVVRAQERDEIVAELDANLVTSMISGMMGTGLIDALLHRVGRDRHSLGDEGLALQALDEAELQRCSTMVSTAVTRLVKQTTEMLRRAFCR
ncbi:MAG: hypothetical protein ACI9MR_001958 [Myxococcota bacterium]